VLTPTLSSNKQGDLLTRAHPSNLSEVRTRQVGQQPARNLSVLLVDDDRADTSLVLSALSGHPYVDTVRTVDESVLALRQLLVGFRPPDLVLLDVYMPRIDGFELLEAMRRVRGMVTVPVVFLTTSDLEKDLLAYRRSSAAMYVVKPDTFAELQIRMDGIVERAICGVWNQ
jgi:DNA-binding response OmpR family regulator